jgi:uncharacterized membrane protein
MRRIAVIGATMFAALALVAGPASAAHDATPGAGKQCIGLTVAGLSGGETSGCSVE